MAESVHVLHFNSFSSIESHPGNELRDFVCRLPQPLVLEPLGEWYACLKQCSFGFVFSDALYVCCDLCSDVIAGERRLPVLRVVHQQVGVYYDSCLYIPVKTSYLNELRFYLVKTKDYSKPGYTETSKQKPTNITLELKRIRRHRSR